MPRQRLPQEILDLIIQQGHPDETSATTYISTLRAWRLTNHACSKTATPLLFDAMPVSVIDAISFEKLLRVAYSRHTSKVHTLIFNSCQPYSGVQLSTDIAYRQILSDLKMHYDLVMKKLPNINHLAFVGKSEDEQANTMLPNILQARVYFCANILMEFLGRNALETLTISHGPLMEMVDSRLEAVSGSDSDDDDLPGDPNSNLQALILEHVRWDPYSTEHTWLGNSAFRKKLPKYGLRTFILNDCKITPDEDGHAGREVFSHQSMIPEMTTEQLIVKDYLSEQDLLHRLIEDVADSPLLLLIKRATFTSGSWTKTFNLIARTFVNLQNIRLSQLDYDFTDYGNITKDRGRAYRGEATPAGDKLGTPRWLQRLFRQDVEALISLLRKVDKNRTDANLPMRFVKRGASLEEGLKMGLWPKPPWYGLYIG